MWIVGCAVRWAPAWVHAPFSEARARRDVKCAPSADARRRKGGETGRTRASPQGGKGSVIGMIERWASAGSANIRKTLPVSERVVRVLT